jgi:hypothetical protein
VLGIEEALHVACLENFEDGKIKRIAGEEWFVHGPRECIHFITSCVFIANRFTSIASESCTKEEGFGATRIARLVLILGQSDLINWYDRQMNITQLVITFCSKYHLLTYRMTVYRHLWNYLLWYSRENGCWY